MTFSVIDDGHAIAEPLGFLDIVRGHYNRFFLPFQFFDDVVNLSPHLGSRPAVGSSKNRTLGIVDESHGEGQALLLAAGELAVIGIAFFLRDRSA